MRTLGLRDWEGALTPFPIPFPEFLILTYE